MTLLNRRQAAVTLGGLGLTVALPTTADAQPANGFSPFRLGPAGIAQLNPMVSRLDTNEDQLLDSLLGTDAVNRAGRTVPVGTLTAIQQDTQGLLAGPPPLAMPPSDFPAYRNDLQGILQLDTHLIRQCRGGWLTMPVGLQLVRAIDQFVGRWYPCNNLCDIGRHHTALHGDLCGHSCDLQRVGLFCHHVGFELESLVRYHPCGGRFRSHAQALLLLDQQVQMCARHREHHQCRGEFERFNAALTAFTRRYYSQWCV